MRAARNLALAANIGRSVAIQGVLLASLFTVASAQTEVAALRSIWAGAERGDNPTALRQVREYLLIHEFSTEGLDLAGVLATREGLLEDARQFFLRALRIKPESVRVLNNLGFVYLKEKDGAGAIRFLRAALALNPDFVDGWNNLAHAFSLTGDKAAEKAALAGPSPSGASSLESASECVRLVSALRQSSRDTPRLICFDSRTRCAANPSPMLVPDLPAVLKFRGASFLEIEAREEAAGAWVFWSTPEQEGSGSARMSASRRLRIPLSGSGILYLMASRPLELGGWTVE